MNFLPALMPFALAAGVLSHAGPTVKVLVTHQGSPVEVEMLAVDENLKEIPGTRTFPGVFQVGSANPRRINMQIPKGTWAVCVRTTEGFTMDATGASLRAKSCARVRPGWWQESGGLNFGRQNGNALRDALTPQVTIK